MSIDNLLDRTWSMDYTCNEFACEAWQQITGDNLSNRLRNHLNGVGEFQEVKEAISPCIVFFTNLNQTPTHVGVFFQGKILHLSARGVQYMPLELVRIGFKEVRFYR
ncbi:hypothetical protein [Acinetobacter higginsii]|uniref:hypothetical protein n=1 Tax=Acinetobacter higginsii TaxID=70347 RepID=UPI00300BAA3A